MGPVPPSAVTETGDEGEARRGREWREGQEGRRAILSAGTREASRGPSPLYGRSWGEAAAPALKMAAPAVFPFS